VGEVKKRLGATALFAGAAVQSFIKDFDLLKGQDFYVQFQSLSPKSGRISLVAEFQDGRVVLH
jgi:hypothetical protein